MNNNNNANKIADDDSVWLCYYEYNTWNIFWIKSNKKRWK